MKKVFKLLIRIGAIIWGCLVIFVSIDETVNYLGGNYIQIEATVAYVHQYEGLSAWSDFYDRANGYLTWEYNDTVFVSEELIDLPADAQEGDIEIIWIDSETGEYEIMQSLWYTLFGCALHLGICAVLIKCTGTKKSKADKMQGDS